MKIYDGGSDEDSQFGVFTGNTLPSPISSTRTQMFISYTNNGNGALEKKLSASFIFGKKIINFNFLWLLVMYFFFDR